MSEKVVVYEVQSDISPVTKAGALLVSWLLTYTIASVSQSQFVLANLESLGVNITGNQWLEHTVLDWWGLLPKYGSAVFAALCIALYVSGRAGRILKLRSNWLHPLAGGLAMALMLTLMQPLLDVTLIAGTRSFEGQLWQVIAGVTGGLTYKLLRQDVARWIIQRPRQNARL